MARTRSKRATRKTDTRKQQRKRNRESNATKTTYKFVVDVTDIIQPVGGMGYKSWARTERDLSSHDQKKRAKDLIRRVEGIINGDADFHEYKGSGRKRRYVRSDWVETQSLTGGQSKRSSAGYFFSNRGRNVNNKAYKAMKDNMNKVNDNNHNTSNTNGTL